MFDLIASKAVWLHGLPGEQCTIVPSRYQRDWHTILAVFAALSLVVGSPQLRLRLWIGLHVTMAPPKMQRTIRVLKADMAINAYLEGLQRKDHWMCREWKAQVDLNMQSLRLVGYHCKGEQPRDAYSVTTRILWFPALPPSQLHDMLRFACYKR